jgi:hypothetical protein
LTHNLTRTLALNHLHTLTLHLTLNLSPCSNTLGRIRRLLIASIHSYIDPSSGAALATREVLELLAARGWACRALTCGVLDNAEETPLDDVLTALEQPTNRVGAALSLGDEAEVFDLELDGARVTLLPTHSSRPERSPNPREAAIFLDLVQQVFHRFRPQVLLTYGGHPVCMEMMRRARARGIGVVFHLHNFGYNDPRAVYTVERRCAHRSGGRPVGGRDRAALGRPGIRSQASRLGQGRSTTVGHRARGRAIRGLF